MRNAILPMLLFVLSALAQDTTVKITGTGPRSSTSTVTVQHKSSLVTFSLGNGTIDGSGKVALPIAINSKTGQLPAAVQFDAGYAQADITGITFTVGAAAASAGKNVTCAAQTTTPPSQRCIVAGGMTGITDGVIAVANIQTSLTAQSTTTAVLFGAVSASIQASQLNSTVAQGGGVISMPALLASVTCSQPDIWQTALVSCSLTLNKPAPAGGAVVTLASDSVLVATPASVQIAAGATSAPFNLTGM